ncbi:MAG: hypothetical protein DRO11_00935 [Methanobacteriota archaeon]|nr:MAG: hypothetical protein DRO11_00935 [Euryarchaeota archaeon]
MEEIAPDPDRLPEGVKLLEWTVVDRGEIKVYTARYQTAEKDYIDLEIKRHYSEELAIQEVQSAKTPLLHLGEGGVVEEIQPEIQPLNITPDSVIITEPTGEIMLIGHSGRYTFMIMAKATRQSTRETAIMLAEMIELP